MKAVFYEKSGVFAMKDIGDSAPGPNDVIIKVAYCGICGTDLHIFNGKMDQRVAPPQIIGHEMSGTVHCVGKAVKSFTEGARVTVCPLDTCGECAACMAGHSHICMNMKFMGIDSPGAFQEYWKVDASTVFKLPATLPLKTSALIEPLAVACHDVERAKLKPGELAVVIGGGPIGILIAMVARNAGAEVLISEISQPRRELAERLGFTAVDPLVDNLCEIVEAKSNGAGAHVVFEVSASRAGAEIMSNLVRPRGRIVIVGIYSESVPVDLHRFFWRELELLGTRLYSKEDFVRALEIAPNLPLDELISRTYDLNDIETAFSQPSSSSHGAMKTLIKCT